MGHETTTINHEVNAASYRRFKQLIRDKHGSTHGHIAPTLEEAMELYVQIHEEDGHTGEITEESKVLARLGQIEARLSQLESGERETVSNRSGDTSTSDNSPGPMQVGSEVEKKLRTVISNLPEDTTITESMLEAVIEDHAGTAYKTKRKYKRLLTRRGHVLNHPAPAKEEDEFVTSPRTLAVICEESEEVTPRRVDYLVGEWEGTLGEGWYVEALPEGLVTGNRTLKYEQAIDGADEKLTARRRELTAQDGADRTFQ